MFEFVRLKKQIESRVSLDINANSSGLVDTKLI